MNFGLRHPEISNRVIAMSGMFNIERWLGDYRDDNVYLHSPCLYLPNEHDSHRLDLWRRLSLIIAVGRDDPNIGNNRWFSDMLWQKGIWHALRVWDGWAHDWPWWQKMIQLYIHGAN
jgi:esterase/lipase superfamily enzyme